MLIVQLARDTMALFIKLIIGLNLGRVRAISGLGKIEKEQIKI